MDLLPIALQTHITQASEVLERTNRVPIWYRQALYGALGPPQPLLPEIDFESAPSPRRQRLEQRRRERGGIPVFRFDRVPYPKRTIGHRRRTVLAITTVEYVCALLDASQWSPPFRRQYAIIQTLLLLTQRTYAGQDIDKQAFDGLGMATGDAHSDADALHLAAQAAYSVAQYDGDLQLYPLSPVQSDHELYAFRHDVAGLAAIAVAGQFAAFWQWWVNEAVPAAWRAHPE